VYFSLSLLMSVTTSRAASYTIDGDLSDWGVTPFSDWVPSGTADYEETDEVDKYTSDGYGSNYDAEALYFDDDKDNYYFAVVTSYYGSYNGDLGIDLNNDFTVTASKGIASGLEYAIELSGSSSGRVLVDPVWSSSSRDQGHPRDVLSGTHIGWATVVRVQVDYPPNENKTIIYEISVPRIIF
jgi:hypothetical protein